MERLIYRIEKVDFSVPLEISHLVALQNAVYEGKHTFSEQSFLFWYVDNPRGPAISFAAWDDKKMVANYSLIPVEMEIESRIVRGLLSMGTVTHPEHQGKGLFKTLASTAFEEAKLEGFEFVIGVANDNSYPGFIKHFSFQDVGPLDVLIGFREGISSDGKKTFSMHWDTKSLLWRTSRSRYWQKEGAVYSTQNFGPWDSVPFLKTFLGDIDEVLLNQVPLRRSTNRSRPITLYIGIGSNALKLGYRKAPSFLHRSKFHLIFSDLKGSLPIMTNSNVFFQLLDFDVI